MNIKLAGFNVDIETLKNLSENNFNLLTPETLSASYARISRSAKSITELRSQALEDVARARKSNSRIIFEMGHHSVAEHAVFNFDIMDVSRLAIEEIEKLRLVSFTEKSQRYVKLKGDYCVPVEISDPVLLELFNKTVQTQNDFYAFAYEELKKFHYAHTPAESVSPKEKSRFLERSKEDARYALSLATYGQVGMTINARNLEHLLRKTALSRLQEVRDIGGRIFSLVRDIAPSIILFASPSAFDTKAGDVFSRIPEFDLSVSPKDFVVVKAPENGDDTVLAALISVRRNSSFGDTLRLVSQLSKEQKKELYSALFFDMEFFDTPPRAFELPSLTFQAHVSAASYAQLKRHRMATLITGSYTPMLGNTIPESFVQAGIDSAFRELITSVNLAYEKIRQRFPEAADYLLTNSHRRQVLVKMNLREIYHFIRLRHDSHAQWDIRSLAERLLKETQAVMPLAAMMCSGKSNFAETYSKVFNKTPNFRI